MNFGNSILPILTVKDLIKGKKLVLKYIMITGKMTSEVNVREKSKIIIICMRYK